MYGHWCYRKISSSLYSSFLIMPYLRDQRFHLVAIIFIRTHETVSSHLNRIVLPSFRGEFARVRASFRPRRQNLSDFSIPVPAIDRESISGSANEAQRFAAEITFSASSNNRIAQRAFRL